MTYQKPIIVLTVLILVFALTSAAQQAKRVNPLMLFFQNNYDSTIIYHSWSSWHPEPDYRIVARKGERVYFFTYRSPYTLSSGRSFPGELMTKFMNEQFVYERTIPDTNRYFLPVFVQYDKRVHYWENINNYNIWKAQEVPYEQGGCDIDDGGMNTFYLITGKLIRVLDFYSPDFFETCKTSNVHRQTAIKTRKAFEIAFNTCR